MTKKEIFQNCSLFLLNCFHDAIDQHYEEEIALAVAQQKEKDIYCAIASFFDLNVSESEIMRLLSKFYNVDSIEEATELITTVKVEKQLIFLRDYLNELGMTRVEVVNYLKNHCVKMQLTKDSKLQNMSINKLKDYFDKH